MATNVNASTYTAKSFLNQILKNITYNRPNGIYLALFLNNPSTEILLESNYGWGAYEISGSTYNRKLISTGTAGHSDSPLHEYITNNNTIQFDYPIYEDWNVGYIAIMDSETGGNVLFYKDFEKVIYRGDSLVIPANEFTITTAGTFSNIVYNSITYPNVRADGMTRYLAEAYLNLMIYTGSYPIYPQPSELYIALFYGNPDTVCNNLYNNIVTDELSGYNYVRVPLNFVIDDYGLATAQIDKRTKLENRTPNFKVTHYAIMDSISGGMVLFYGTFRNGTILDAFDIPDGLLNKGLVYSKVRVTIQ